MGLVGIYIGTIVSGLIANIFRPIIIYKVCFEKSAGEYFVDTCKYMGVSVAALLLCYLIKIVILRSVTLVSMVALGILVTIVFNGIFFLFFYKTDEFQYLYDIFRNKIIDVSGKRGKK